MVDDLDSKKESLQSNEVVSRDEISRLERVARDELSSVRKEMTKSFFTSRSVSAFAFFDPDNKKERHPAAVKVTPQSEPVLFDYQRDKPLTKSCLRNPARAAVSDKKGVRITDDVTAREGCEAAETDIDARREHIRDIASYTAVKYMVKDALHERYGRDAADPDGWLSKTEELAFLDDIYKEVKDCYQRAYNQEAGEFERIKQEKLEAIKALEPPYNFFM